jgi:hypothetical protein
VAHPHWWLSPSFHSRRTDAGVLDLDEGAAELAGIARHHLAPELLHQRLLAVADAERRQAAVEDLLPECAVRSLR